MQLEALFQPEEWVHPKRQKRWAEKFEYKLDPAEQRRAFRRDLLLRHPIVSESADPFEIFWFEISDEHLNAIAASACWSPQAGTLSQGIDGRLMRTAQSTLLQGWPALIDEIGPKGNSALTPKQRVNAQMVIESGLATLQAVLELPEALKVRFDLRIDPDLSMPPVTNFYERDLRELCAKLMRRPEFLPESGH